MSVSNFIELKKHYLVATIYCNGFANIQKSFSWQAKKWIFDPSGAHRQQPLTLLDRICHIGAAIGLALPVVNVVVYYALKYFTTYSSSNAAPLSPHTGAGVLPYCSVGGQAYFLLSKEGFGSDRDTWCDFGGAKDGTETPLQTAARECWEESRSILGDQQTIEGSLAFSPRIGQNYALFFMHVAHPSTMTNKNFTSRVFTKHCHMEKTQIAWVKAQDVLQAVQSNNQVQIDGVNERIRPFFAKMIREALHNPQEKVMLEKIVSSGAQLQSA